MESPKWLIRQGGTDTQVNRSEGGDKTFRILSGAAILLVILGHLDFQVLTLGGLFPYYSYHVMVFLFVSGYFYQPEKTGCFEKWFLQKVLHLLVPYYLWNLFYGILAAVLRGNGFSIGEPLNFRNLVYEPFLGGHQFALNFPAWFVPALFLVQLVNVLMRRVLALMKLEKEWLIFPGTLVVGILVVYLAQGGHIWGPYLLPGRILFLLPVYELGYFYKIYLEKRDRLRSVPYFVVVFAVQLVIKFTCGGLAFSAVWVSSFANLPFVPYLTTITGIALLLRISRLLAEYGKIHVLDYLGQNSFGLMMHHILGFFCLGGILYLAGVGGFDAEAYFSNVNYVYTGVGNLIAGLPIEAWVFKSLYVLAGVGAGLLLNLPDKWIRKILNKKYGIRKIRNKKNSK